MIQRFLGHKNIRATVIYTHITPNMLAEVKNPLDCLMESKKKGGKGHV
jgi:site-specific recombinase XerD